MINVPDNFELRGLRVSVDITHTYRGDLQVALLKDGAQVKLLQQNEGGSAQDLIATYTLTAAELSGLTSTGNWVLKVVDNAADDNGTINRFRLGFAP